MSSVKALEMLVEGLLVVSTNCLASGTRFVVYVAHLVILTMRRSYIDQLLMG